MKSKTRKEIAEELKISRSTFYRLLKKLKIKLPKGLIYGKDQKKIREKLDKKETKGS